MCTARGGTRIEYRRLTEDQLFAVHIAEWGYQTPEQPEFDEERARQVTRRYKPEGFVYEEVRPRGHVGGLETTMGAVPVDALTLPFPRFGDWTPLTPLQVPVELQDRPDAEPVRAMPVDRRPWRPPLPLQPTGLEEMFTPGRRYLLETDDAVTVDVRSGGALYLPSGRLIAAWR